MTSPPGAAYAHPPLHATTSVRVEAAALTATGGADLALFRMIGECSSDLIAVRGPDGQYLYASRAVERLFGWKPEEIVGKPAAVFAHPGDAAFLERAAETLRRGEPVEFEFRFRCADGRHLWASSDERPFVVGGELSGSVAVIREVEARHLRDEAHRAREALLEAQSECSQEGYVTTSLDRRLVAFNQRAFELWALSPEEVASLASEDDGGLERFTLLRLTKVADPDAFLQGIARQRSAGEAVVVDEIPLRDGRVLERYGVPTRDGAGRPSGRISYFRDVTARRRADAAQQQRARQQEALATLGELAINAQLIDPLLQLAASLVKEALGVERTAVLELSPDGERCTFRAEAGSSRGVFGTEVLASPGAKPSIHAVALETGMPVVSAELREEQRFRAPALVSCGVRSAAVVAIAGRERPFGVLGAYGNTPRSFGEDEVRFLQVVANVLGAAVVRSSAEREVVAKEQLHRAVFDHALDGLVILDDEGRVVDASLEASRIFGRERSTFIGSHLAQGAPDVAPEVADAWWRRVLVERRASGEFTIRRDGGERIIEYSAVAGILPGRHLAALRDVTEARQMTLRLALADRMASVGTLAAGVAHELNNPLSYVIANLSYVAEELGGGGGGARTEAIVEALREARDGAERMRVIIRDLKTFTRGDEAKRGPVDVHAVLETCVSMAWNEIKHRAMLTRELGEVPPVLGNEARLGQLFLNLIVNAAQAIREGAASENRITVTTRAIAGDRVSIAVSDTGCGIPPQNLKRIFDPFFTTKPVGVGTGLGLAICHGIVQAHGGELRVTTEPGRGSTFEVVLPAAVQAQRAAPVEATAPPARRAARILVVDDEPLVRAALRRALSPPHAVVPAATAREALALIDAGERFDVILTDLLMPEMTGMDLHRELSRRDPALARRTLLLTGGAFTPAARTFLEENDVVCVDKPFDVAALRELVSRRLDPAAAG